jgi:Periplasmic component of the Tol biopolymer transport system
MINNWRYLLFILFFIINSKAFSQNLVVDITEGNVDPLPIALQKFVSDDNSLDISDNIIRVISNDLNSTGLFDIVDPKAYIEEPKSPSVRPSFKNWDPLGVKALVTGSVNMNSNGNVEVEFRLWDVVTEQDLTG